MIKAYFPYIRTILCIFFVLLFYRNERAWVIPTIIHITKIVSASINRYNVHRHEIVVYDLRVIVSVPYTFVFRKRTCCVEFVNHLNYWKYAIGVTCTKKNISHRAYFMFLILWKTGVDRSIMIRFLELSFSRDKNDDDKILTIRFFLSILK